MLQLNQITNLFRQEIVQVDSLNFKLHYQATAAIFLFASLIVCKGQFFGEPIHCTDIPGVSNQVVDSYCWVHQTFLVPSKSTDQAGIDFAHPGVAPDVFQGNTVDIKRQRAGGRPGVRPDSVDIKRQQVGYYQWVGIVLFLQALCFVAPKLIWRTIENNRMLVLIQHNLKSPVPPSGDRNIEVTRLAQYWASSRGTHGFFAVGYLACEALNLVNVVGQMFLIDRFLGNSFMSYGIDIIEQSMKTPEERVDVLSEVFPKVAKCTFRKYGYSGQIDTLDTMCILPINVVNEKVYIVIWFWLVCLASMTTLYMMYLLAIILGENFRIQIISSKLSRPRPSKECVVAAVYQGEHNWIERLGDWLFLNMLFSNLDQWTNSQILKRLNENQSSFSQC